MNFKRKGPEKPVGMNGDNAAIWGFLMHLNGRIDALYGLGLAMLLGIAGTLVAVILK